MSLAVNKSPQAFRDLDELAAFIGMDNPEAAIRFLEFLEDRFRLLASSPGMGRLHPELGDGLRGFPINDYIVFYRQVASGIEVVRVLHAARDIEGLFRG